ncbi:MAG: hypothetical protein Q8898_15635 [Bacillota bacterium]|nr:hypothetical protein [Bacillota bacterium]
MNFKTGECFRPPEPAKEEEERIPFPYDYQRILLSEKEFAILQEQFVYNCNMKRWQHIRNAEVKPKK